MVACAATFLEQDRDESHVVIRDIKYSGRTEMTRQTDPCCDPQLRNWDSLNEDWPA